MKGFFLGGGGGGGELISTERRIEWGNADLGILVRGQEAHCLCPTNHPKKKIEKSSFIHFFPLPSLSPFLLFARLGAIY